MIYISSKTCWLLSRDVWSRRGGAGGWVLPPPPDQRQPGPGQVSQSAVSEWTVSVGSAVPAPCAPDSIAAYSSVDSMRVQTQTWCDGALAPRRWSSAVGERSLVVPAARIILGTALSHLRRAISVSQ